MHEPIDTNCLRNNNKKKQGEAGVWQLMAGMCAGVAFWLLLPQAGVLWNLISNPARVISKSMQQKKKREFNTNESSTG
jgi:hypothetical protein